MKTRFEIEGDKLVWCDVRDPHVVVPEGIKIIGIGAFQKKDSIYGQERLVSVVLPKSVEVVGAEAFRRCENLEEVTILGPALIEQGAFASCKNLQEVYLADGVWGLESGCFSFCENLSRVYLPKTVTHLGQDLAEMNGSSDFKPIFVCYRKSMGEHWDRNWARQYVDPRFRNESNTWYHMVFYGKNRDMTPRTDVSDVLVTDIPHCTGEKWVEPEEKGNKRVPDIKMQLWLTATRIDLESKNEYALDEEEKIAVEKLVNKAEDKNKPFRRLNEPWELVVNEDHGHGLDTQELDINAWLMLYMDGFDGHTLIVHHDAPWHTDKYEKYPASKLTKGGTIVAEKYYTQNNATFDVRLNVKWLEQEKQGLSMNEVEKRLWELKEEWGDYKDGEKEIEVSLAYDGNVAKLFKVYKPSEFPEQLIEDLRKEEGFDQVVVQPYRFYQELHSYSDDYRDAAEAYGEDCDDWYSTERCKDGDAVRMEVDS